MMDPKDDASRWEALMDRQAAGDELDAGELSFCEHYAKQHPEAERELELYAQLADLEAAPDEATRALVDGALERMEQDEAQNAVVEASTFRRKRVSGLGVAAVAIAVACGAILFFSTPDKRTADGDLRGARASVPAHAELVYASGTVQVAGKVASVGRTLLAQGNVIETGEGTACVLIDPEINVCLSEHSRLRLTQLGVPARTLTLEQGKAATRLATQPDGMSLSIAVGDVLSTAVGTAFSVERRDDHVITTVLNGKVRVGRTGSATIVAAHERAVVEAKRSSVTNVTRSEEAPSWAMLGPTVLWHDPVAASLELHGSPERAEAWLDGQHIGMAPLSTLVPVGSHRLVVRANGKVLLERDLHMNAGDAAAVTYEDAVTQIAATQDVLPAHKPQLHVFEQPAEPALSAKALTPEELGLSPEPEPAAATAPTASELLSQARRSIREGRYAQAAASYEAIGRAFPGSEEAQTVLVSLGQLELTELGKPSEALQRFDAYLARGGALAEEARIARVKALRNLGRSSDEARAIEELLAKHPRSFVAAEMRARLAVLREAR